jgi:hypothetical protein
MFPVILAFEDHLETRYIPALQPTYRIPVMRAPNFHWQVGAFAMEPPDIDYIELAIDQVASLELGITVYRDRI